MALIWFFIAGLPLVETAVWERPSGLEEKEGYQRAERGAQLHADRGKPRRPLPQVQVLTPPETLGVAATTSPICESKL
jgi:hypothetical protein